jgi:hypothetical protein
MPARRKSTPSYLLHQQSGRGRVIWTKQTGLRRYKLLPEPYDSPESRTAFARLLLELEAAPHHTHADTPDGTTMAELLLAFMEHADRHYSGPDGKRPTPTTRCRWLRTCWTVNSNRTSRTRRG